VARALGRIGAYGEVKLGRLCHPRESTVCYRSDPRGRLLAGSVSPQRSLRNRDFGFSQNGTQVKRYRLLDTDGWAERELRLPNPMELSPETRVMPSELLIPLAQVSGAEYYFGRVFVPVKLLWKDERLGGGDRVLEFDLARESALDNQLDSAILGKSTGGSRP
jgi:hypothetical protein